MWAPALEQGSFEDGGAAMRHRPLAFWLDYVRSLTELDAPLLVTQGHCDRPAERRKPDAPTADFRYVRSLSVSAKTDLGLGVLREEIEEAVRDEIDLRPLPPIRVGRAEVREMLRSMWEADQQRPPAERQHRTLAVDDFRELCERNGKISDPGSLLDYLHQTGVVYYRPELFEDRIILDRRWALDAIYTLFDRERTLPVLNRHGRFSRRELELLVWGDYSEADQLLFLSFIQSCGICFPVRRISANDAGEEWEYIAPELLPEWSEVQDWLVGRMQGESGATASVHYDFLHEGILRNLFATIGRRAQDHAIYWKYG